MSNNEGLPISIIEAMRTGLPVISTKISGIPELVDINGILIDPNVEQLTTIFDHMDEYDWNVMGKRSRERWKKDFTFDRMKNSIAICWIHYFNKYDGRISFGGIS